ncbi:hypothetical protein [Xenorhabdus sp. BG5]|uniref:hypothetical protein n=1 Tax=Xenorhabdus sp. BG5 TaxID=2782014 RepID=UPI00187E1E26|nr:hypothetical protein [Xenorhabdus sp. BG5]MBE8596484.1 hypothetical protein [Xenorhabdus sp. BG5]
MVFKNILLINFEHVLDFSICYKKVIINSNEFLVSAEYSVIGYCGKWLEIVVDSLICICLCGHEIVSVG